MHPYTFKNWLWVLIVSMFVVCFMISGCSTVAGVGKDITDVANGTRNLITGDKK